MASRSTQMRFEMFLPAGADGVEEPPRRRGLLRVRARQSELTIGNSLIPSLDPLGADARIARLPEMNAAGDLPALTALLNALVPDVGVAHRFHPAEAAAALRDLGMLLASIRRHGGDPLTDAPALTPVLKSLAATCGDMPPRETVYHYGPWNPRGIRERRFLLDDQERLLIDSTRVGAVACQRAIESLLATRRLAVDSAEFGERCRDASESLRGLETAMAEVKQKVSPVFFAQELRPYFEEIDIDGVKYPGAAAATLPLGVVDHLLWSSDCDDTLYREFHADQMRSALPDHVALVRHSVASASILTRCLSSAKTRVPTDFAPVEGVFASLLRFRGRHKAMASKAYTPTVTHYDKGSGGYSLSILAHVFTLTKRALQTLSPLPTLD